MKAGTKQSKTKQAKKAFKEWNENRTPIEIENSTELFQAADDEYFVQFPEVKYWYVSNKGNIITFYNPSKPKLVKAFTDKSKRGRERYTHGKNKNWMSYEVVAKAFNSYIFGKAKAELLKGKYELHHIRQFDYLKNRPYNNDPELLEWVTSQIHTLLTYIQEHPQKPTPELMEDIAFYSKKEAPGQAVIITDGGKDHVGIFSMSNEELIDILKKSPIYGKVCGIYYATKIKHALDTIVEIKGNDYFIESKYVLVPLANYTYIFKISNINDEIFFTDCTSEDIEGTIEPIVVKF